MDDSAVVGGSEFLWNWSKDKKLIQCLRIPDLKNIWEKKKTKANSNKGAEEQKDQDAQFFLAIYDQL